MRIDFILIFEVSLNLSWPMSHHPREVLSVGANYTTATLHESRQVVTGLDRQSPGISLGFCPVHGLASTVLQVFMALLIQVHPVVYPAT